MDEETSRFYAQNAARLKSLYNRDDLIEPDRLIRCFTGAERILDVGCGTGRDLAFLLKKGKDAYGVDASPEMIEQAQNHLVSQQINASGRLFVGDLPSLRSFRDAEFDGVLCYAVLMHLPEEQLFDAVYALRRVLKSGGLLFVSIPSERADVNPTTRRDRHGRLFSDLPPSKLQLLLERTGFSMDWSEESADTLGRPDVTWWSGRFRRMDDSAHRPLHLVESILNRDKKDATYKLALFRALAEIAQTQPHLAAYLAGGRVMIPLRVIAEKGLLYYWPIFESADFIPQRTNEQEGQRLGVAIRKPIHDLVVHFASSGGLTGFYCDWKAGRLQPEAGRIFHTAIRKLQSTIHSMPGQTCRWRALRRFPVR